MRKITSIALLLIACPSLGIRAEESAAPSYRVIVNSKSTVEVLDKRALADLFLKKVKRWPEDEAVRPVDLKPESPARRYFSEGILKRSVAGVRSYWQQLIFSGRDLPPPELENDEAVVKYVGSNPGSIGYISGSGSSSIEGVRVVDIR